MTRRPDVSLSRRCTTPGRSAPAIPERWGTWASTALTSVPLGCPGAGCTVMPAGLSMTRTSASSWTIASGMGWGATATGSDDGARTLTCWPARSRNAGFRGRPSTRTCPRPAKVATRDREYRGKRSATMTSRRRPRSAAAASKIGPPWTPPSAVGSTDARWGDRLDRGPRDRRRVPLGNAPAPHEDHHRSHHASHEVGHLRQRQPVEDVWTVHEDIDHDPGDRHEEHKQPEQAPGRARNAVDHEEDHVDGEGRNRQVQLRWVPGLAEQHDGPGNVRRPAVVETVQQRADHRDRVAEREPGGGGIGDLGEGPIAAPAVRPCHQGAADQRAVEGEPGIDPDHQATNGSGGE